MTFKATPLFILISLTPSLYALDEFSGRELTYYAEEKKESVRLYGNIRSYAYWYLDLLVGTPPQRTSVIVDTGSTVCAFACKACTHCGAHIDAAFDLSASSTASWSSCSSDCPTSTCLDGHCSYSISYSEGSSVSGYWFTDVVQLGDGQEWNIPVKSHLGCHTRETKLFYTQSAGGILGLAPGTSSPFPSILSSLFSDERIDKRIFSICIASEGGELTVGGFNAAANRTALAWVPLRTTTFYQLSLSRMSVGPNTVGTVFGSTILDSGTTLSYFPVNIFASLSRLLEDVLSPRLRKDGTRCWITDDVSSFPEISFELGSAYVYWQPTSYMYESRAGVRCYAFEESTAVETILGASFFMNLNIVFDLANKQLGIAPADCPHYTTRPDHSSVTTTQTPSTAVEPTIAVVSPTTELRTEASIPVSFRAKEVTTESATAEAVSEENESNAVTSDTSWGVWLFWIAVVAISISGSLLAYRNFLRKRQMEPEREQLRPSAPVVTTVAETINT